MFKKLNPLITSKLSPFLRNFKAPKIVGTIDVDMDGPWMMDKNETNVCHALYKLIR